MSINEGAEREPSYWRTQNVRAVLVLWRRPGSAEEVVASIRRLGIGQIWAFGNEGAHVPADVNVAIECNRNLGCEIRWNYALNGEPSWLFFCDDDVIVSDAACDALMRKAYTASVSGERSSSYPMFGLVGEITARSRAKGRPLIVHGGEFAAETTVDSLMPWGLMIHSARLTACLPIQHMLMEAVRDDRGRCLRDDLALSLAYAMDAQTHPTVVATPGSPVRRLASAWDQNAVSQRPQFRNHGERLLTGAKFMGWRPVDASTIDQTRKQMVLDRGRVTW